VLLIVVLPLTISTAETYGELESTMMRIQKARTVMGQKDALKAQKDEITQVYRADGAYLPSEASAIASASLQSRIKQILMESDAELASLQVLPDRKEDQFDRVGIKVRFNSDTKALRHVLYNIETNQPYLFVDYLSVRAIRGASGSKSQVDAEQLTVEVDVLGYMRPQ
jgi:general secretion pathway protein M